MPALLFVLFVVVPLVELVVIQQVAAAITWGPTLVLLVVDSLLGAWLVRREGSRAWRAVREALQQGRLPGDEIVQGALVLGGGALLLTPGFVTDVVGLALVLPLSRAVVSRTLRHRYVPVQIGADESVLGGLRRRDAPGGPRATEGRNGPGGRRRQAAAPVEDVEVLSVERDVAPDDGPAST